MEAAVGRKNPWRMVRRDSPRAIALAEALAQAAVTLRGQPVTPRKIETLSGAGFISEEASDEEVVTIVRALDGLDYGPGKDADDTACRLLSRYGLGTPRARQVVKTAIEEMLIDPRKFSGDELKSMKGLGPMFSRVLAACATIPDGARQDYAGVPLHETPDQRTRSALDDAKRARRGKRAIDPDLIVDVARSAFPNPDRHERVALPDDIDLAETVMGELAAIFHDAPALAAGAPLPELAIAAVLMNGVLRAFGDNDPEIMAAKLAPVFLAMRQAMAPQGLVIGPRTERDLRTLVAGTKKGRSVT